MGQLDDQPVLHPGVRMGLGVLQRHPERDTVFERGADRAEARDDLLARGHLHDVLDVALGRRTDARVKGSAVLLQLPIPASIVAEANRGRGPALLAQAGAVDLVHARAFGDGEPLERTVAFNITHVRGGPSDLGGLLRATRPVGGAACRRGPDRPGERIGSMHDAVGKVERPPTARSRLVPDRYPSRTDIAPVSHGPAELVRESRYRRRPRLARVNGVTHGDADVLPRLPRLAIGGAQQQAFQGLP